MKNVPVSSILSIATIHYGLLASCMSLVALIYIMPLYLAAAAIMFIVIQLNVYIERQHGRINLQKRIDESNNYFELIN